MSLLSSIFPYTEVFKNAGINVDELPEIEAINPRDYVTFHACDMKEPIMWFTDRGRQGVVISLVGRGNTKLTSFTGNPEMNTVSGTLSIHQRYTDGDFFVLAWGDSGLISVKDAVNFIHDNDGSHTGPILRGCSKCPIEGMKIRSEFLTNLLKGDYAHMRVGFQTQEDKYRRKKYHEDYMKTVGGN